MLTVIDIETFNTIAEYENIPHGIIWSTKKKWREYLENCKEYEAIERKFWFKDELGEKSWVKT